MAFAGVSTLGMDLGMGAWTSADTAPAAAFTAMGRINAIGGIELSQESIDASAIIDKVSKYVEGRSDTGGEWTVTVNVTDATITEWEAVQGQTKWFEVYHPNLAKAWFVAAAVPATLPLPEVGQNELLTMEISLVVKQYYGLATKVAPTGSEGGTT